MDIQKMKEVAGLMQELRAEGVMSFNLQNNEFHVNKRDLLGLTHLQIESRSSTDYPYEISIKEDGVRFFALAKTADLKDFPQFKEFLKADLKRQLAYLEEDVDLSGMGGEEHVS
jgi:hypothetical protein